MVSTFRVAQVQRKLWGWALGPVLISCSLGPGLLFSSMSTLGVAVIFADGSGVFVALLFRVSIRAFLLEQVIEMTGRLWN